MTYLVKILASPSTTSVKYRGVRRGNLTNSNILGNIAFLFTSFCLIQEMSASKTASSDGTCQFYINKQGSN